MNQEDELNNILTYTVYSSIRSFQLLFISFCLVFRLLNSD